MKSILDEKDIMLLSATQAGIPLVDEPFRFIAKISGLDEDEVIVRMNRMLKDGLIRRFGISINNRKLGLIANAMVAWKVPTSRVEEVGKKFSENERVTHCYERVTIPGKWPYNIYTVLHGYDHESIKKIVQEMSDSTFIREYLILFSTREHKKTGNGRIVNETLNHLKVRRNKA